MKVELKGILQAHVEDLQSLPEIAPKGFVYLNGEDLHITLLTMTELRPFGAEFRKAWKEHADKIPPFPEVAFEKLPYIAKSKEKSSWVLDLDRWSQLKVWYWLYKVLSLMGLERNVQPSKRIFHVSLANRTGSKYDSVPDPWNYR